jgi:uncharacterized protein (DUF433 family)
MDWSKCADVEIKPDVVAGAWVVKGTLVPAGGLVENAEDGFTPEEIATEIYPAVTVAAARRIIAFARQYAYPVYAPRV